MKIKFPSALCILYFILHIRYTCIPHSRLYTPHSTLDNLYSTLYTPHSTLHTLHFTPYTPHSRLYTFRTPPSTFDALHSKLRTWNSTLRTWNSTFPRLPHGGLQSALLATKNSIYLLKILPKYYIFHTKRFSAILQLHGNVRKCHDTIEKERFCNFPQKYDHVHKKIRISRRDMLEIQKKYFVREFLKFSYFVISESIFFHEFSHDYQSLLNRYFV